MIEFDPRLDPLRSITGNPNFFTIKKNVPSAMSNAANEHRQNILSIGRFKREYNSKYCKGTLLRIARKILSKEFFVPRGLTKDGYNIFCKYMEENYGEKKEE
jgi:hypothetical protein